MKYFHGIGVYNKMQSLHMKSKRLYYYNFYNMHVFLVTDIWREIKFAVQL